MDPQARIADYAEMDAKALEKLTPRQKECLRLVSRDRGSKEIAQILGISDETVEVHVKAAMRRLSTNSRFTAARALADFEGRNHPVVIPTQGEGADTAAVVIGDPSYQPRRVRQEGQRLREEAATFGINDPDEPSQLLPSASGGRPNDLTPFQRVALAAVIAAAIVIVGAAARPLAEGFQALANLMQPYQH